MTPNQDVLSRNPYLVVGAGAQGFTFALELALKGEPVVLVDRSASIGGQARSFHYGGFTFDFGLHAFVSYDAGLQRFVRRILGGDYRRFYPRAASRLGNGAIVEDTSSWCVQELRQKLYSLVEGRDKSWNCMRIAQPPPIVYPRRGGFGGLFDRMAALFREHGGLLLLDTPVSPADFSFSGGRLKAARIAGRRVPVRGCYWSAGSRLLKAASPAPAPSGAETFVLFHFLLKGGAPLPYHWVRLYDVKHPLLPRLAYYPKRFSAFNAPAGHYGVGAVVPVPAVERVPAKLRRLIGWFTEDPAAFLPLVRNFMNESGLLRREDVLETFIERMPMPPDRPAAPARHPFDGIVNFWESERWSHDDEKESGVPLQMRAALKALDEVRASSCISA